MADIVPFRATRFGGGSGSSFGKSFSDQKAQEARDKENLRRYEISQARLAQQDALALAAAEESKRRWGIQEARLSGNANRKELALKKAMTDSLAAGVMKDSLDASIPVDKVNPEKAVFDQSQNPYDIARNAITQEYDQGIQPSVEGLPANVMEDDSTQRQQVLSNKFDPQREKEQNDLLAIINQNEKENKSTPSTVARSQEQIAKDQIDAYKKASQDGSLPLEMRYMLQQAATPQTISPEGLEKVAVNKLKKQDEAEIKKIVEESKRKNLTPAEQSKRKKTIAEAMGVIEHGKKFMNDDDSIEYSKAEQILKAYGLEVPKRDFF